MRLISFQVKPWLLRPAFYLPDLTSSHPSPLASLGPRRPSLGAYRPLPLSPPSGKLVLLAPSQISPAPSLLSGMSSLPYDRGLPTTCLKERPVMPRSPVVFFLLLNSTLDYIFQWCIIYETCIYIISMYFSSYLCNCHYITYLFTSLLPVFSFQNISCMDVNLSCFPWNPHSLEMSLVQVKEEWMAVLFKVAPNWRQSRCPPSSE